MQGFQIALLVSLLTLVSPSFAALKVFACEPEWAALSKELGGDRVEVYSATSARQDVHRIQARPSLIARVRNADLVVCSGAELEAGWLPLLLRRAANARVQPGQVGYFMAAEQVERLDIPSSLDRAEGDVHASGNPHVHLDPQRLLSIAHALGERMQRIDPVNAGVYQSSLQHFEARWSDAMRQWRQRAAPLAHKAVVVHHKDWRYLLDWLQMQAVASLEPKPGLPPSASHLARLKAQMARQPAAMILRAAYQEARPSLWLSEQSGIPALELPYTVGGSERADDLFGLFDDTIDRLLQVIEQ